MVVLIALGLWVWWLCVEEREKRKRHGAMVWWLWVEEREKRERHGAMVVVIDLGLWVW